MAGIIVFTTTPTLKSAKTLARLLVTKKLAACVSVKDGFVSFYPWKRRIESARETLLFIKTSKKNFHKVKKTIQAMHSYELPEIVSVTITQASAEYLSWLNKVLA